MSYDPCPYRRYGPAVCAVLATMWNAAAAVCILLSVLHHTGA